MKEKENEERRKNKVRKTDFFTSSIFQSSSLSTSFFFPHFPSLSYAFPYPALYAFSFSFFFFTETDNDKRKRKKEKGGEKASELEEVRRRMTKKFAKEHLEEVKGKKVGGRKDMEKGRRQKKRWKIDVGKGRKERRRKVRSNGNTGRKRRIEVDTS
jgi:hypothetical protein